MVSGIGMIVSVYLGSSRVAWCRCKKTDFCMVIYCDVGKYGTLYHSYCAAYHFTRMFIRYSSGCQWQIGSSPWTFLWGPWGSPKGGQEIRQSGTDSRLEARRSWLEDAVIWSASIKWLVRPSQRIWQHLVIWVVPINSPLRLSQGKWQHAVCRGYYNNSFKSQPNQITASCRYHGSYNIARRSGLGQWQDAVICLVL